jgi:hypothetical protein
MVSGADLHPAAKFQFERAAREYARWRAVTEDKRSPAAAWWWETAMMALHQPEIMPPEICQRLELPLGTSYHAGAEVFIDAIAPQTVLPWPDQFPRNTTPHETDQPEFPLG